MKYYLEITMLNQQIFNTEPFEDSERPTFAGTLVPMLARERALNTADFIFNQNSYTLGDIIIPTSQIAYITIKPLTSTP